MRELNDDLYQRFNGFKSVKRGNKKQGQSDWYYLDPRYNDNEDPRGEISVIAENSPNPQLNAILASDIRKNPDNYYVWRTKGDNKVRDRHRQRDGVIFNWHIPPEGGHPGEDHNCRCRAEPFNPDKHLLNKLVVDVSGLDLFKELAKDLKPIDFNISGLPQYVVNNKANVTRDVGDVSNINDYAHRKVKFRSLEEEKLLRHMAKIMVKHENIKEHPYLDAVGKITVGKGMNVDDWNLFKSVHWLIDGRPATEYEVKVMYDELGRQREKLQKEYDEVQKFKREHPLEYARWPESKKKDHGPFNYTAGYYAQFTNIRITEDEADYLMYSHLQDDYDTIKGYLDGFDNQPMGIKEAAFDIQYNTGNIRSFSKFKRAYNANDISGMAKESGRIIINKERNDDIKNRILKTK